MLEVISIIGVLCIGTWFLTKIDNTPSNKNTTNKELSVNNVEENIPAYPLPEYRSDIRTFEHHTKFPLIGEKGVIYVDESNSILYYWSEPYYHSYLENIVIDEVTNEVTPVYHPHDEHIVLSNQDGVIRIDNRRPTLRERLNQISEQHRAKK